MSDSERYEAAAHGMQSGVAFELEKDPRSGTPKHLRVGINSCQVNEAAMARLLIEKGIITDAEYCKAIADEMERERDRYQDRLRDQFGTNITLI